ncbi:MAG: c-type cytochrome [Okeania sp. SIO2F4]|uniref:cytochrome c6 PetJ n=1 Tax=Okeania sp. SIO2F4 TaxID=2607790 RepID=UPI00142AB87C|nr:c-type cytochrome [Okeania sp. SIO2F4]NES04398.1 c-type cytochrome [Okeania sp. SIO2F4]
MKKLLSIVLLAIAFVVVAVQPPALAADVAHGKQVFVGNCAACHIGGKNSINPTKTLSKADLEKYGMYSAEKIAYQVTNGKNAMPNFKRLGETSIEDVTAYVLAQAEAGW